MLKNWESNESNRNGEPAITVANRRLYVDTGPKSILNFCDVVKESDGRKFNKKLNAKMPICVLHSQNDWCELKFSVFFPFFVLKLYLPFNQIMMIKWKYFSCIAYHFIHRIKALFILFIYFCWYLGCGWKEMGKVHRKMWIKIIKWEQNGRPWTVRITRISLGFLSTFNLFESEK